MIDPSRLIAEPKIRNGLPLDIKQSTSADCFKSTFRTFLFNNNNNNNNNNNGLFTVYPHKRMWLFICEGLQY